MRAKNVRTLCHFTAVTYSTFNLLTFLLLAYKETWGTYFVFFDCVGFLVPTLLVLSTDKVSGARYAAMFVAISAAVLNLICIIVISVDWSTNGAGYLNMNNVTGLWWAVFFIIVAQALFLILSIFSVYLLAQMDSSSKEKKG